MTHLFKVKSQHNVDRCFLFHRRSCKLGLKKLEIELILLKSTLLTVKKILCASVQVKLPGRFLHWKNSSHLRKKTWVVLQHGSSPLTWRSHIPSFFIGMRENIFRRCLLVYVLLPRSCFLLHMSNISFPRSCLLPRMQARINKSVCRAYVKHSFPSLSG
jgi:hypothetical protein